MTSRFGWLDQDDAQRAAMNEVVKLFQDKSTVDELGIGTIRDAFSNAFFPGTSSLHTRARYLLFIPWLLAESTRRGESSDQARVALRNNEVKLIKALVHGGVKVGVIGAQAQDSLKTMPSELYWPALQRLGLVRWDLSIAGHLRRSTLNARRGSDVTEADAADATGPDLGLDPELPARPDDLLRSATFALDADEAAYLQSVLARLPGETLYGWLAARPHEAMGEWVWSTPALGDLPVKLANQVDHARRIHHAWHGAPVLYNLMLARLTEQHSLAEDFDEALDSWEKELDTHRVFEGWDRSAFWGQVRTLNPRLSFATQDFVERWLRLAESGEARSSKAENLIAQRELRLKGRRSRIQHAAARETWAPGAGTARLGYRWNVARSVLEDIEVGLHPDSDAMAEVS